MHLDYNGPKIEHHIKVDNHLFMQDVTRRFRDGCKSVTFTVYGVSMHPFLGNGRDKVVLAPPMKPEVGQVILAEIQKEKYALHRIIKIEGDLITMQGDGNFTSSIEQFTTDKIIGTAIAFVRKNKYVSTDSRLWRSYSAIWMFLRPIRRYLLAFYRKIILKIF